MPSAQRYLERPQSETRIRTCKHRLGSRKVFSMR